MVIEIVYIILTDLRKHACVLKNRRSRSEGVVLGSTPTNGIFKQIFFYSVYKNIIITRYKTHDPPTPFKTVSRAHP